ncbi:hypothetical protein FF2_036487 [Malus domestica]
MAGSDGDGGSGVATFSFKVCSGGGGGNVGILVAASVLGSESCCVVGGGGGGGGGGRGADFGCGSVGEGESNDTLVSASNVSEAVVGVSTSSFVLSIPFPLDFSFKLRFGATTSSSVAAIVF